MFLAKSACFCFTSLHHINHQKQKKFVCFTHFGTTESKHLFYTAVFDPDGIHNTNGDMIDIFWSSSSITAFQRYNRISA